MQKSQFIKRIEIKNYRGFQNTQVDGFGQINLIGGKNNIGKSMLLETLLLNSNPSPNSLMMTARLRGFEDEDSKNQPDKVWRDFFYEQNLNNPVQIKTFAHDESLVKQVSLISDGSKKNWEKAIQEADTHNNGIRGFIERTTDPIGAKGQLLIMYRDDVLPFEQTAMVVLQTSEGLNVYPSSTVSFRDAALLPATRNLRMGKLAEKFDNIDFRGEIASVLDVIQKIDPSIEDARTFSQNGSSKIYLRRNEGSWMLLSAFGGAIYRVLDITLELLNNSAGMLLIDEIETGVHFTAHKQLWCSLFELASERDVQIFATTHSLEMLQAFQAVRSEMRNVSGAYIEMTRNFRTENIVGIVHDTDTLAYELQHHAGVRGE